MPRISMPAPEAMTAAQRTACEEVMRGPRGKVPTPMIGWMPNPELASRLQSLGALLRFDTTLGPLLTELAILICARHWTAHVEWTAHKALALKAGMDPRIAEAIAARRVPELTDPRAQAVYSFSSSLLSTGRAADELYRTTVEQLGDRGVTELIALLGYYSLVALTLNAFELGLPESVAPELMDPEFFAPECQAQS